MQTYYIVLERPRLMCFFKMIRDNFDIFVYTNGTYLYAKRVITMIECKLGFNPFVDYYTRQQHNPTFIKSLTNIKYKANFSNTIIVDDISEVWPDHQNNLIVIKPYFGPFHYQTVIDDNYINELINVADILLLIKHDYDFSNSSLIDLIKKHKHSHQLKHSHQPKLIKTQSVTNLLQYNSQQQSCETNDQQIVTLNIIKGSFGTQLANELVDEYALEIFDV